MLRILTASGFNFIGWRAFQNVQGLLPVVRAATRGCTEKKIWAYSGYEIDDILEDELRSALLQEIDIPRRWSLCRRTWRPRPYVLGGSSNQRIIDVKKTLAAGEIVLAME